MKIEKPFVCVVLLALSGAFLRADAQPATPPAAAPAPASSFTDAQKIEEVGWIIAKRSQLADLNLNSDEVAALLKGFTAAMAGKPVPYDLAKIGPEVDTLMQAKQTAYMGQLKQQNATQSAAFFAKLKDNKNVVESPTGLRYEIVSPGQGPYPKATDTVKVNYTGTLIDGTEFDSSARTGQPAEFALSGVIAGWTEGIQKINKGGKIRLYVPSRRRLPTATRAGREFPRARRSSSMWNCWTFNRLLRPPQRRRPPPPLRAAEAFGGLQSSPEFCRTSAK
jgi:FKBP-type peptidyl-prolyl cis-trans isomerase